MRLRNQQTIQHAMAAALFACAALVVVRPASAEDAPRSYLASPDVYKVVAENNKTRVIVATWKPGQRDQWHSHPATGVYYLTDCQARVYSPDGTFREVNEKAGFAVTQLPIPSHSFENRSSSECRIVIVEQEP